MKTLYSILIILLTCIGSAWGQGFTFNNQAYTHVTCYYPSPPDGTITVTISPDNPHLSYVIQVQFGMIFLIFQDNVTGDFPINLHGLDAGNYVISVRYAGSPFSSGYVVDLLRPSPLKFVEVNVTEDCTTNSTMVTVIQGVNIINDDAVPQPFSYTLLGPSGNEIISGTVSAPSFSLPNNLPIGTYRIEFTDGFTCAANGLPHTFYRTFDIVKSPISATEVPLTAQNPTCHDRSDGRARVRIMGGVAGTVSVGGAAGVSIFGNTTHNGIEGEFEIRGLSGGNNNLTITVTGTHGTCDTPILINLTAPLALAATYTTTDPCYGSNDGIITLTRTPGTGTGAVMFSINGGAFQTGNTFMGLAADVHTITIRDANLCTVDIPVTLNAQTLPFTAVGKDPDCFGETVPNATGNITITPNLGSIEFQLDGGGWVTTPFFGGLPHGNYTVTSRVTVDARYCYWDQAITLIEPEEILFSLSVVQNATCDGVADGELAYSILPT